ncbi:MAG: acyl-CoA/acyl-ACP dehydrogenase [Pseudomonadales bacterium]|nr:acyl-CoA/acyl-ACP dehydrogenase [Pseudomonadales bacterium]MBO7005937.1 acyl-CoA/acyl-ACP dehydrogenase [Pseudomonadales bacterium]
MNFEFSEEQDLLREQALGFLTDNCPPSVVRKILEGDESFDADLWQNVVEMGWTATVIPEAYEGLGLSYLELSVIAEELGRALAPLPFSSSVYLATEALMRAGSETQKQEYLPKLAAGSSIGCFAFSEGGGQTTAKSLQCSVSGGKLRGTKLPVADGDIADFAVVIASADRGDGASAYLVDLSGAGVNRETVKTIDPSRSHARITFDGADAELLGEEGQGWTLLENVFNRAAVLFAWEQVGGADTALNMAKEYALGRFAFGRPIASFQAIKHKLANIYVKNTLARSNCYFGAWAISTEAPELPIAAATARVSAIQAYYFASKENVQTHGGMGFTWEFDCQFPYRRSKLLATNIGSEATWQDKLISAVEADRAA